MARLNETREWAKDDELDAMIDRMLYGDPAERTGDKTIRRYSRDPRSALFVIEALTQGIGKRSTTTVTLTIEPYEWSRKDRYWLCTIEDAEGYDGFAAAETMPMAVCLAFLNLHEAEG